MKYKVMKSSSSPALSRRQPFFAAAPDSSVSDTRVQRKLTIGAAGDQYEQQADAMADHVIGMNPTEPSHVQAKCANCAAGDERLQRQPLEEEEEEIQAKPDATLQRAAEGPAAVDQHLEQQLKRHLGSGSALPPAARARMNSAFGVDFSSVRLHTSPEAIQLSHALGARAFTYGRDVFFNQASYDADSTADNHLLAHELTHVVQQGGVPATGIQNKPLADNIQRQSGTPELQLLRVDYPTSGDGHVQHSSNINNTYYVDWDAWIEDDVLLFEFEYNGTDNASVTVSLFDTERNGYIGGGVVRWGPDDNATQYIEFTEFPPTVSGEVRDDVTTRTVLVNESHEGSGITAHKKIFRGR